VENKEERKPRIFIGIPCYGKVDPEILEDFMRFAYHCGRRLPQYEFHLGIKTKSEQFRARNAIVDAVQQTDDDWLLMIDDDMIINEFVTMGPTDAYSFIEKLIKHGKDICGILYYQRSGKCDPVLMKAVGDGRGYRFLRDDEIEGKLQRVDVAGGGCLLIRAAIFDKLKYPYFGPEFEYGTDIQLCRAAAEKGIEVWADTSIEFGHLRDEKTIVTSRNRTYFQTNDTVPGEAKRGIDLDGILRDISRDALEYTGYKNLDEAEHNNFMFIRQDDLNGLSDYERYLRYPNERISRQVWFNTTVPEKREETRYILATLDHSRQHDILDFGCGVGITAFILAKKGHRVSALDLKGTGTFEFLKWRSEKHKIPINFIESLGGPPELNGGQYDVIIAMDAIEHVREWEETVKRLVEHLKVGGILFSNNAILGEGDQPEHYKVANKEFLSVCVENDLMPYNQICFIKKEQHNAKVADSQ
jgi:2-polyprenyl-3-methyl-5-hydroxy-6-metoxy-1,4-benzoquinol methylase